MNVRISSHLAIFASLVAIIPCAADEALEGRASWSAPQPATVKAELDQWLSAIEIDELSRAKIDALWSITTSPSASELLDTVAVSAGLAHPAAMSVVEFCSKDDVPLALPEFPVIADESLPPVVRNNLALHFARWLVQHDLYDEALTYIKDLKPEDVVDPASLLFYQAVGYHRLIDKEKCLPILAKLLEAKGQLPRRYETVALLMESDLKPMKTDSLDEVARLMDDIERHLGFGRAGSRVRQEEDDVIAKLDKMIEELEQQQQQQSSSSSGGQQSSRPMQDSMPGGGSGPGNVEQRRIGSGSGWGNLPPKQRQEALQQISKGLPSHYREVIEEYFRKLARDGN